MYTISIRLTNRSCIVVGGGSVAERRIGRLLEEGAQVTVISPEVTDRIAVWANKGELNWCQTSYEEGHLPPGEFVFITTDNGAVNDAVAKEATQRGSFINRADRNEESDFTIPSMASMGDLSLAIFTNGVSPRVNRLLRMDMEARYGVLEDILPKIRQWRDEVKALLPRAKDREEFWQTHLDTPQMEALLNGHHRDVEEIIVHAINCIRLKP